MTGVDVGRLIIRSIGAFWMASMKTQSSMQVMQGGEMGVTAVLASHAGFVADPRACLWQQLSCSSVSRSSYKKGRIVAIRVQIQPSYVMLRMRGNRAGERAVPHGKKSCDGSRGRRINSRPGRHPRRDNYVKLLQALRQRWRQRAIVSILEAILLNLEG